MKRTHGFSEYRMAPDASGVADSRPTRFIKTIPLGFLLVALTGGCADTSRSSHDRAFILYWPPPETPAAAPCGQGSHRHEGVGHYRRFRVYLQDQCARGTGRRMPRHRPRAECPDRRQDQSNRICGDRVRKKRVLRNSGQSLGWQAQGDSRRFVQRLRGGGGDRQGGRRIRNGYRRFHPGSRGLLRHLRIENDLWPRVDERRVSHFAQASGYRRTDGCRHSASGAGHGSVAGGLCVRLPAAVAAKPSARQIRIGRLYINGTDPAIDQAIDEALAAKGFKVVKLDERFKAKWAQAESDGKTIALARRLGERSKIHAQHRNRPDDPAGDRQGELDIDRLQGGGETQGRMAARSRAGFPEGGFHRHADASNSAALDSIVRFLHRIRMAGVQLAEHRRSELRWESRAGDSGAMPSKGRTSPSPASSWSGLA